MNPDYHKKLSSLGVHFGINLNNGEINKIHQKSSLFLEGERRNNSLGEFFFKENDYIVGYEHGRIKFSGLFFEDVNIKFPDQIRLIRFNQCVFIDTETTGLSQSGGTFAFMVGVGFFIEKTFIVRQYFLIDPSQEDAMLLDLLNLLDQFDILVSYNGLSFDIPIIRSRYKYHRIPNHINQKEHIDLLKYARILFRYQLDNRSLKNIEKLILHFERNEDEVPGYLAPIIYQNYLRTKEIEEINGVFYHNAMDVVSLVAFMKVINEISTNNYQYSDHYETLNYSIAKQFEKNKSHVDAIKTYKLALDQNNLPETIRLNCMLSLAKLYKNANLQNLAINYWKQAIEIGSFDAHIELAKIYEHKFKDFEVALDYCKKALLILENDIESIKGKFLYEKLQHRIKRIINKASK